MSESQITLTKKNIEKMYKDLNYLEYAINTLPYSDGTKAFVSHYAIYAAKSSRWQKYCYYGMSALVIVLPSISSAIEIVKGGFSGKLFDWIPLICNSLVTIFASLLALCRFHEKWTRYRNYLENLINIIAVQPVLCAGTKDEKEKNFVDEIRLLNSKHQTEWIAERKKESK